MSSSNERSYSLRPRLRPLVILGAPRSGTKLLRSLLGQSAHCTTIPFGINHVWRTGLAPNDPDRRPASDGTTQRTCQIRSDLLNLADAHQTPPSGYLVEKTCANTLRVPFVNRVLPDAQFIHILRDGRDAAVSAREKWNRPPDIWDLLKKLTYISRRRPSFFLQYLSNLWTGLRTNGRVQYWGPRYDGIRSHVRGKSLLTVCAHQWKACVAASLNDLSQISTDRVTTIQYESLVTDQSILDRVIETLGLPNADEIRNHYQAVVHDRSVGRWRQVLSSDEKQTVTTLLQPLLDHLDDSLSPSLPS